MLKGDKLPIMEAFYTIQGEGAHSGKAAYFVRLGGCDVGCVWCDVKESWDFDTHPFSSPKEIIAPIVELPAKIVVITGGEPAMYDLMPLTTILKEHNYSVNIETSGAYPISGEFDWICFSPKKFKKPHPSVPLLAHELKIIVFNESDFEWALSWEKEVNSHCRLFVQPEWSKREKMMPLIVNWVKQNPRWEISLQTHKYLNIP